MSDVRGPMSAVYAATTEKVWNFESARYAQELEKAAVDARDDPDQLRRRREAGATTMRKVWDPR
jgi:hypothetical protein